MQNLKAYNLAQINIKVSFKNQNEIKFVIWGNNQKFTLKKAQKN